MPTLSPHNNRVEPAAVGRCRATTKADTHSAAAFHAPRGTDSDCAYMGGSVKVNGGGVTYPIILGACITTAAEKIVAVYTYDDPGKDGDIAGKMRSARSVAMSIRPAS